MSIIEKFVRWLFHKPRKVKGSIKSKVRQYKRSIKFQCSCGKWALAAKVADVL